MVIFYSYVSLPEGNMSIVCTNYHPQMLEVVASNPRKILPGFPLPQLPSKDFVVFSPIVLADLAKISRGET
jgi:hypothetical protein